MIALLALVAPSFAFNWYLDSDGDGYGDSAYLVEADTAPPGYVDNDNDCDDDSALAHPGGSEACDGLDNDCSGRVDEGDICPCAVEAFNGHAYMFCETTATASEARDFCSTYGYDLATISTAEEDAWVDDELDARSTDSWWVGGNDLDAEGTWTWVDGSDWIHDNWASAEPGDAGSGKDCLQLNGYTGGTWADEPCDAAMLYVCESGYARSLHVDGDGDGYGDPASPTIVSSDDLDGYADNADDCDDAERHTNPGEREHWYDGVDRDCQGGSDYDADRDGFDSAIYDGDDCDDRDEGVNPGESEIDGDGVDQDCDGVDGGVDSDEDGIDDGVELEIGTDPFDPDTDDGGVPDGEELGRGSDPLDPADDFADTGTEPTDGGSTDGGTPDGGMTDGGGDGGTIDGGTIDGGTADGSTLDGGAELEGDMGTLMGGCASCAAAPAEGSMSGALLAMVLGLLGVRRRLA